MGEVTSHLQHILKQANSPIWGGYVNMLKTLEAMFQSPKHWVLEFLQNAEDASASVFEIRLNEGSISILNDGTAFNASDFQSVCDVNSKKLPSLGLRGYLGIGFKSIFRITDSIQIHSGDFHFSFDRTHWTKYVAQNGLVFSKWPWEILPVEIAEIPMPEGFKTVFEVPLKSVEGQGALKEVTNYLTNDGFPGVVQSVGLPKEIMLLVNHVKSIHVKAPQYHIAVTKLTRLSETVALGDGTCQKQIANVKKQVEGQTSFEEADYLVFRKQVKVDEGIRLDSDTERVRRSDIQEREIGLVFPLDSMGNIVPSLGTLTGVYSFLPIEGEQTGLPFGIFGDFIPSPGRDQINYGAKWNLWMCQQILEFLKQVVLYLLLKDPSWKSFPAAAYDDLKRASRGAPFWNENLRQPVLDFLNATPIFLDQKGKEHILDDLFTVSPDIENMFGDDLLEKATGKKRLLPAMKKLKIIQSNVNIKEISTIDVLHSPMLLDSIKPDIQELCRLYGQIEHIDEYQIKGRRGRETPFREIPFVLGSDNLFHTPQQVRLLSEIEQAPAFLNLLPKDTKVPLHLEIAKDITSVDQLKRCGMEVVDLERTIGKVEDLVNSMARGEIKCQKDEFVEASLWLLAHGRNCAPKVVVEDGTFQLPSDVFVAGARLDWRPLWQANLLPGYFPVSHRYSDLAPEYDVKTDQLNSYFEEAGIHGFSEKKDERLTQTCGESFAETHLRASGHNPKSVADHDKLGYDLECQGHCHNVYEVKGMTEASDVPLQASQVDKAQEYAEYSDRKYILVCVYNLPSKFDSVGYKEVSNPERIWKTEEKARVPKKKWLNA